MQYIIHITNKENPFKEKYKITADGDKEVFLIIKMLEKNPVVLSYMITQVNDHYFEPVKELRDHFVWGFPARKFIGVDPTTLLKIQTDYNPKTEYWRYTNPVTEESINYRFSEAVTQKQAIRMIMLDEPKFLVSVNPNKINDFVLNLIEPWIQNESLDVFDVTEYKKVIVW